MALIAQDCLAGGGGHLRVALAAGKTEEVHLALLYRQCTILIFAQPSQDSRQDGTPVDNASTFRGNTTGYGAATLPFMESTADKPIKLIPRQMADG